MRHPLIRLLALALGAAALVIVLAFGLVVAAALVIGGAVILLVRTLRAPAATATPTRATPAADRVIEGEFTVTHATEPRQPTMQ